MTPQVVATRDEMAPADHELADQQARALFEAGENKWGTNEEVFVDILSTASAFQMEAIRQAYGARRPQSRPF